MKQKEKNKLFRCNIIIKHLFSGFFSSEKDMGFSPTSFYGSPEWTNTLCQFYLTLSPKPPQKIHSFLNIILTVNQKVSEQTEHSEVVSEDQF